MFSKNDLLEQLRISGINPEGTLLIHSSMKAVGECENGADTVLDAFIEYMRDGLLIFPTHTWSTIGEDKPVYDRMSEPSCVGILTNLFMKREGVVRSYHPTHSVGAIGRDAEDYIRGDELARSPCPRDGCWGKLYDRRAQILFLGCPLSKNTYLHGVEEWNNIPYRLSDTPTELFVVIDGEQVPCPQNRHKHPTGLDVSSNYIKMEGPFVELGIGTRCVIGSANSVLCDAVGMADLVGHCLKRDADLFGKSDGVDSEIYADFVYKK